MRLTKKINDDYYSKDIVERPRDPLHPLTPSELDKQWDLERTKLGQLEDIEDELGIDLITLFKAFNGIYYKKDNKIKVAFHLLLTDNWSFIVLDARINIALGINDYGKTWALTKEELEQ